MLKAIIIDDEQHCVDVLNAMLQKKFADEIELAGSASNAVDGRELIALKKPDLVFLDVEMPNETGLDLLMTLEKIDFEVIFTTAHEQYALKAIKLNALDYLLKPFSIDELEEAIKKCKEKKSNSLNTETLRVLIGNLKSPGTDNKKIGLPTGNGIRFVNIRDIIRIESENNYSHFFFSDKTKLIVSKTLKEFEDMLEPYSFYRVHNSHLINLSYVQSFLQKDGDYIILSDGSKIEVSRRRKADLMEVLKTL
ncbi:MAG: LytTR family DNA-binding domain-containing protein [Ferruginibacter sp.]